MLHTNIIWVQETPMDHKMTVVWSHHFFSSWSLQNIGYKHISTLYNFNVYTIHYNVVNIGNSYRTGVGKIY